MEKLRFQASQRWIWSSSSRKSWQNWRRPRIYLAQDVSIALMTSLQCTYVDIILSNESWSTHFRWLPWNLIGTRVPQALLTHMIHWVNTYAHQSSNLLWMDLKSKHPCNKTTCFIGEFVDTSGDRNGTRPWGSGQERRKEWSVNVKRVHAHSCWYLGLLKHCGCDALLF